MVGVNRSRCDRDNRLGLVLIPVCDGLCRCSIIREQRFTFLYGMEDIT